LPERKELRGNEPVQDDHLRAAGVFDISFCTLDEAHFELMEQRKEDRSKRSFAFPCSTPQDDSGSQQTTGLVDNERIGNGNCEVGLV
jgi:hypothetical protein